MESSRYIPPFGLALIFVGVFSLVAWCTLFFGYGVGRTPINQNAITDLATTQIPFALPQNIIVEKDATIVHSYTAATPSGDLQSTILYTTEQPLPKVLAAYADYLTKNGWKLNVSTGQSTVLVNVSTTTSNSIPTNTATLTGIKSNQQITVYIIPQTLSTLTVSITLLSSSK